MEASFSEKNKTANMAQPAATALALPKNWLNFFNKKSLFQKFNSKLDLLKKTGALVPSCDINDLSKNIFKNL